MADLILLKPKSPIDEALLRLSEDAGALFAPAVLENLRKLRDSDPAAFARIRQRAKESKAVSMAEFDRLTTAKAEAAGSADIFDETTPWADPVDGAGLLADVAGAISLHVVADRATIDAAALWCLFTWLLDAVQVAPIANITAPEKRCGKTVMLSAIGKLSYRPLQVSNIASAALFRSIELWSPTLLIDEVDSFLRENEEARGIINSGFTRDSAFVIRCVGDDHTPTRFGTWSAKTLCGIGKIADTLADRSIPLRMRRKRPGERAERLRHSDPALWAQLRQRIARFVVDNREQVAARRPAPMTGLNDRAADCWEPLLQIAEVAGGEWPDRARRAAIALHGAEGDSTSTGAELLADIRAAFDGKHASKMFTADLLAALCEDEESPWPTWNRGKPLSPRQLASKLAEFGIRSRQIRIGSATGKMGFERGDFTEAWTRYLPADTAFETPTPLQPSNHAASGHFQSSTASSCVEDEKTLKATDGAGCREVDHKSSLPLEEEEF